jgi:hypothetical protein
MKTAVIVSAVRSPLAGFGGALSSVGATDLGAHVIREAVKRAGIDGKVVNECIMGMVLPCGYGQNPAKQAAIKAELPQEVEAITVNKVCGSSLKAVMLAAQAIQCGDADVVVAGGMENMSMAPYYMDKGPAGLVHLIRGHAHVVHTAGHENFGIAALDGLGGQHHRLERGTADLVDGDGLDFLRQFGLDRGLFGRILAIATGKDHAHDALIDNFSINTGPFHGFPDDMGPEIRGAETAQGAAETGQGAAHRTDDDRCFHTLLFSVISSRGCRLISICNQRGNRGMDILNRRPSP